MEREEILPARQKPAVGKGLLVIVLLSIGLSVLAGTRMVGRVGHSDEAVRAELGPVVDRYRALSEAGDRAALAEWIDPAADPTWRTAVLSDPTIVAPAFTTSHLGKIGTLDENTEDVFQVEVLGTFQEDGVSVSGYAYLYFRRSDGSWMPTFPVVDQHWGPTKQFDSGGVTLEYRVEESQDVLTALTEIAALNRRLAAVDPAVRIPALTVKIDPVTPLSGLAVEKEDARTTVRLRSPSVGWGAVEPTTHVRAQYADALLGLLAPSDDLYRRAARRAVARYWVGQLNQAHPLFDTDLIAVARPMVVDGRWPTLVSTLTGDVDAPRSDQEAALTTAYLWLLAEGLTASDVGHLIEVRNGVDEVETFLADRLEQTPAEVEAAWQRAARVRYAPDE